MSKSNKSYMHSESLLSEGFLDSIKNWIKKDQIKTLNKNLDKVEKGKAKVKSKLSSEVDTLNKAMAKFDALLQSQHGIKTGKTPKLSVKDFIKESNRS